MCKACYNKTKKPHQWWATIIIIHHQTGRILYISENAAEYLGHSMEDLLIHGDRFSAVELSNIDISNLHSKKNIFLEKCPNCSDFLLRAFSMIIKSTSVIKILCSIYDIVDKQDHPTLHLHLARYSHHSHQFIHHHHHLHDDHGQGRG